MKPADADVFAAAASFWSTTLNRYVRSLGNGGAAAPAKLSVFDGATERVIHNGPWAASLIQDVRSAAVLPASSPWRAATLNALVARFGYSTDATDEPSINGLMIEYEVGAP